jgi:hypothetical protein
MRKLKLKLSRWLCQSAGGDWGEINRDIIGFINPKDMKPIPLERRSDYSNMAKQVLSSPAFLYAIDWLRLEQGSKFLYQSEEKTRNVQQAHLVGIEDVVSTIKKIAEGK